MCGIVGLSCMHVCTCEVCGVGWCAYGLPYACWACHNVYTSGALSRAGVLDCSTLYWQYALACWGANAAPVNAIVCDSTVFRNAKSAMRLFTVTHNHPCQFACHTTCASSSACLSCTLAVCVCDLLRRPSCVPTHTGTTSRLSVASVTAKACCTDMQQH
jgi:hypothetical protein